MDQIIRAAPGSALARQVPGPRQKWFRLATEAVDGHGTRFLMAGCDLSAHRANPVLLWGHGSGRNAIGDPPDPRNVIGRVAEYDLTRDHLDILCEFDTEEFAALVWRKVDAGLIRACSLGAVAVDPPEEVDGVPTFKRWRLTEASIVIVGSNREALALDRDASVAALGELRDVPIVDAATPADSAAMSEALAGTVLGKSQRRRLPEQVASVAVFRADGSLLFGKRRDNGRWTTPGGHLNPGESPEAGARRELREEAGIDAEVERIGHGRVGDYTVHCYRASVADEEPDASGDPDEEVAEWRWYQKDAYLRERPPLHAPRNVLLHLIGWGPGDGIEGLDFSDAAAVGAVGTSPAQDEPPAERDTTSILYDPVPVDEPARASRGVVRVVTRGVVSHEQEPPTVDVAWDADAAVRRVARWASSDGSGDPDKVDWAKYRLAFAWFDDEHPALGAGKLPHHDVRGGRLVTVWRGVVAAAAALSGARGGVDLPADAVPAVRAHLAAHYREFGKLPPWESGGERADYGAELARAREARYRGIDFRLAPGVASALRDGLRWLDEGYGGDGLVQDTVRDARRLVSEGAWWPAKARAARGWFARHGAQAGALEAPADSSAPRTGRRKPTPKGVAWALWGGDPGKRQVERLVREMDEADHAAERDALAALALGADSTLLQRDLESYLPRSVAAHGAAPDVLTNKVAAPPPRERKMPKLEAQHYGMLRALIGAKCDMAEMHARAHDDLPPDMAGLRGAHRDMAGHSLRQAEELHGMMREAHGKHFEPDGDEGSVRSVPSFLKDEDMKRDFGTVYAALGRVAPTLGQVIREELGDDHPEKVRARVAAMKDDAEQLAEVQEKQANERAAGALARAEALIEEHLRTGRITPARALEMRGHDARTYQPGAQPTKPRWSESRIQEYLAQRQQPAVEVTRAAPLHVVEPPAGGSAPPTGTPIAPAAAPQHRPSMVRVGAAQAPGNVDFAQAAQEMVAKLQTGGIPGVQRDAGVSADAIAEAAAAMQRGEIVVPRPAASGLQSLGGGDAAMTRA